ncbi:MAG: hypothetical protein ACD_57C00300G0002 [uncultured bacterium]|nr:MAG: hypothetical protein ACD_57C00300G0002 [uncultured bacterium]
MVAVGDSCQITLPAGARIRWVTKRAIVAVINVTAKVGLKRNPRPRAKIWVKTKNGLESPPVERTSSQVKRMIGVSSMTLAIILFKIPSRSRRNRW